MNPDSLLAALNWRYAVKKFDPSRKIEPATWAALESALTLAPSSYGLQPYRFFVVDDPELRAELKPVSYGQSQITDAAKLVVFAARTEFTAADVERFLARIAEVRGEASDKYRASLMGALRKPDPKAWAARQAYIALGVFLTSAAVLGVDACPMEGIDPAAYDRILGLPEKGYNALAVATAGYRAADDAYAALAKVRFPDAVVHL